ncbi:hypothetical protein EDB95_1408 [Dinghuibacter silviterrae]|uniref:Uncharacterized protein n=1 Tax=Dinghuibacter silviterrae TaxID=1539049 RepID=A0A4R8DRD2_9BACT|nr:hypothetical protein EDB95_1408 [Dinghuibacter silviterrae]
MNLNPNGVWNGGELYHYTEFKLRILEFSPLYNSEWHVAGLISQDDEDKPYRQGMTDVFQLWQERKRINWFNLSTGSHMKDDYIRIFREKRLLL